MTSPVCSPDILAKLNGETKEYSSIVLSLFPEINNLVPSLLKAISSAPASTEGGWVVPT